jgi:hypothetical protein
MKMHGPGNIKIVEIFEKKIQKWFLHGTLGGR